MRRRKVCVLGPSGVGKTTLIRTAFLRLPVKPELEQPTIGAAFHSVHIDNDIKVEVWDTAGQERYAGLVPMYIRGCACILVCFDTSQPDTARIARDMANVRHYSPDSTIILVGTKSDTGTSTPLDDEYSRVILTSAVTKDGLEELRAAVASVPALPAPVTPTVRVHSEQGVARTALCCW